MAKRTIAWDFIDIVWGQLSIMDAFLLHEIGFLISYALEARGVIDPDPEDCISISKKKKNKKLSDVEVVFFL